jgi:S-formylglutathione hydrolase
MEIVQNYRVHGGQLSVYDHRSEVCASSMRFAIYLPPEAKNGAVPCLWYLSGLTCTWANVMEKGAVTASAAKHGFAVIAPDTSPRGEGVADDEAYDLGQGAGFYLTATESPWSQHYQMDSYITEELQAIVLADFPIDAARQGIFGHSMGGHGALTLHLKNPGLYRTVSAFAPIVAPSRVPWGQKAFRAYLGDQQDRWRDHDASALVVRQPSRAGILIDQGEADQFLERELRPGLFEDACAEAGQKLTLRRQPGYDHSYYFISTFMEDHVAHHARGMNEG